MFFNVFFMQTVRSLQRIDFPQTFFSCQKTVYKQKRLYMCPRPKTGMREPNQKLDLFMYKGIDGKYGSKLVCKRVFIASI